MVIKKRKSYFNKLRIDDKNPDLIRIDRFQYVDHIKEAVKFIRENSDNGFSKEREFQHVAKIPDYVFNKNAHIFAPDGRLDEKAFFKWLNSDEGIPYRVPDKRVS